MYIKDIVLDGFKCYEENTVLRNLDKSYNAITGLNGSGKSNVVDAIVFALGLESKKMLRANSLKELINVHRKECRVTLVLSNTDKERSPPGYKEYEEITISRALESSGKSKYFLNNHVCSSSTIGKICEVNVVMQGHITKVLNMKSREIGALIEETAGTRTYTKEKEKALQVLEKKEVKLKEVKDAMERRISPFYDRLIEEREAYKEQEKKGELLREIEEVKMKIKAVEERKRREELKECQEILKRDLESLREIEEKEEVDVGVKDMLEDEKMRLEDLKRKDCTREIQRLKKEYDSLEVVEVSLEKLREREKLLKERKMDLYGEVDEISKMEELTKLENEKIEVECKLKQLIKSRNVVENEKLSNDLSYVDEEIQRERLLISKSSRLASLKSRINYPFVDGVYGTVGEVVRIEDPKYQEAIYTVMGSKVRHVVVRDEAVGGSLLKKADRRISVIPLSKIRSKSVPYETLREIKTRGGVHALDVIKSDLSLKKAIDFVFSGFFLFPDKGDAKRACFDLNVYCVTLDGIVYDPKGTVTGGKNPFRVEIISRKEIETLEEEVRQLKGGDKRLEDLLRLRERLLERNNLKMRLEDLEMKIGIIKSNDLRKELEEVRREILLAASTEKKNQEKKIRKENLKKEIEEKTNQLKDVKSEIEESSRRIEILKEKIRKSSEVERDGLEPRQKYLIQAITKMKSRISKLTSECDSDSVNEDFINDKDDVTHLKKILDNLQLNYNSLATRKSIRMDPTNFSLLEKYDLDIKTLKEKIKKIEKDKMNILKSINDFDSLGLKEKEKAFSHINKRLGIFLRYFLKDSDSKILKEENSYELKVKIGNWKDSLVELSGGQRSLVALCLIFSMLTYKPASFYIFDEIDAALDLNYTQSIGEIIKREFNNSQFIIISLKNGMYDNANSVFKVFIKDGKSRIAQIK